MILNLNLSLNTQLQNMHESFGDMSVWQNALDLSDIVFTMTLSLPKSEDYGLTSQIRKSSNSATGTITEAFGRRTKKDESHFYIISS